MRLGDIKTEDNLKILLYGNPGCGKTCFAASLPYPMLFLDFDGKADSAALFHKNDKDRLNGIDVRNLSKGSCSSPIDELNKIYDQELSKDLKYKTIVLDSVTTFSALTLEWIVKTNPGIKRSESRQGSQPGMQDYGILKREFAKLIPTILGLPCNVVMLAHISTEKDDLTGEIIRGPLMDGSFAKQLPIYFKEVWRAYVEKDKYLAQTQSDFKYACRSQIPGLPNPVELSFEQLMKHIQ